MNLEGTHTTCSSRMLENYVSPYTATCVSKIIEAGGIPLGKLNMDEFAFGSSTETSAFGRTFNPWDLERVPGGSSAALLLRWLPVLQRLLWAPTRVAPSVSLAASAARLP